MTQKNEREKGHKNFAYRPQRFFSNRERLRKGCEATLRDLRAYAHKMPLRSIWRVYERLSRRHASSLRPSVLSLTDTDDGGILSSSAAFFTSALKRRSMSSLLIEDTSGFRSTSRRIFRKISSPETGVSVWGSFFFGSKARRSSFSREIASWERALASDIRMLRTYISRRLDFSGTNRYS